MFLRANPFTEPVANGDLPKSAWHTPQCTEQSVEEAAEARNRLLTDEERREQDDAVRAARIGHNRPPDELDDPLAKMTPWQIYQRCIWISDEDTNTRISLLALSRYMPKDLRRGCSMSYRQLASDCGFSLATAKRVAKFAVDINRDVTWLRVGVGKGRYVPGKGSENLYFGIVPQKWADELRRRMHGGIVVEPDEEIAETASEVSEGYPETDMSKGCSAPQAEVSHRHPEGGAGYQADTEVSERYPAPGFSGYHSDIEVSERHHRGITQTPLLQIPPEKKKEEARDASASQHLKGVGPTQAEIDAGFNDWWLHYPRKEDKPDAKRAYAALVSGKNKDPDRRATIPQLLDAVKHYRPSDLKYTKLPATWLNKGSWLNGQAPATGNGAAPTKTSG